MQLSRFRRPLALVSTAALLASLTTATVAAPASAAKPRCGGKPATIVGTKKSEVIRGTAKGDVIVARGGNDRIFGRGGHDIICGGGGNDRIIGGPGNDRVFGGPGRDVIFGNPGRDVVFGGPQNDALRGGLGVDRCYQGTGAGLAETCELGSVPRLAIAYSDLNGNHLFDKGDVMIAKLVDANGDGGPSAGDFVVMGRYPTTLTPTSDVDFEKWGVKWHVVTDVLGAEAAYVNVRSSDDRTHYWSKFDASFDDSFAEFDPTYESEIIDDDIPGNPDEIDTHVSSPSRPVTTLGALAPGAGDDGFIDVEVY